MVDCPCTSAMYSVLCVWTPLLLFQPSTLASSSLNDASLFRSLTDKPVTVRADVLLAHDTINSQNRYILLAHDTINSQNRYILLAHDTINSQNRYILLSHEVHVHLVGLRDHEILILLLSHVIFLPFCDCRQAVLTHVIRVYNSEIAFMSEFSLKQYCRLCSK